MTLIASAAGARLDCDGCDHYIASPDLTPEQLRRISGYAYVGDRDLCPGCQRGESNKP